MKITILGTAPSRFLLSALLLFTPAFAAAQTSPPLQASLTLDMPADDLEARQSRKLLEGGDARVVAIAKNRGDVVQVEMRFRYEIPPDTIAFDEIIDRIRVDTISDNAIFSTSLIEPNDIHLNPNRVGLSFRVTLYRPEASAYRVRVRVFGNYE